MFTVTTAAATTAVGQGANLCTNSQSWPFIVFIISAAAVAGVVVVVVVQ